MLSSAIKNLTMKPLLVTFVLMSGLLQTVLCLLEQPTLPPEFSSCLEEIHKSTNLSETVGERIFKACVKRYVMYTNNIRWDWLNATKTEFKLCKGKDGVQMMYGPDCPSENMQTTLGLKEVVNVTIPPSGFRIRREYRMLSDSERQRFHDALNKVKRSGEYDRFASLHQGPVLFHFHQGPNFLGWHRVFVAYFEEALRRYDESVSIPYWDYTMDYDLEDPTQSLIWTSPFLGNGDGEVITGPFAFWRAYDAPVMRDVGSKRSLMSKENVGSILTRNHTVDITVPIGKDTFTLETYHDDVHDWIGSDMSDLNLAPYDPVFYLHHAFVDYIWESFRVRQYKLGIDASKDYPRTYITQHNPFLRMHGFPQYRNIDGLADFWTQNWYKYEPTPSCNSLVPDCGSPYLRCHTPTFRCIPITKQKLKSMQPSPSFVVNKAKSKEKLKFVSRHKYDEFLPEKEESGGQVNQKHSRYIGNVQGSEGIRPFYQNTFFLNGVSNPNEWIYIPVKIIHISKLAIKNGNISFKQDIFTPDFNPFAYSNIELGHPKTYDRCISDVSGAGEIYAESFGLNYYGSYTGKVIFDQHVPFGSSVVYVAVKTPDRRDLTEAVVFVHDRCGRVCRSKCLDANGSRVEAKYRECTGAVRLTDEEPLRHESNQDDVVMKSLYNSHSLSSIHFPQLIFICDFQEKWPW